MNWVPWTLALHITAAILWIGSLFTIARLDTEAAKEKSAEQFKPIAETLFESVAHPALMTVLATGILLVFLSPAVLFSGWFYVKVTCVFTLIALDVRTFRGVMEKTSATSPKISRFSPVRIAILTLILVITSLSFARPF